MKGLQILVKEVVKSNVTAMVFAVATASGALFSFDVTWVIRIFAGLLAIYFVCWFGFLLDDWLKLRRRKTPHLIEYESIKCDWRVNDQGDFEGISEYFVKNIGDDPVAHLPAEDMFWFSDVGGTNQLKCRIEPISNQHQYRLSAGSHTLYDAVLSRLASLTIKGFRWEIRLTPELAPRDRFAYRLSVFSRGTERKAFSDEGTFAGVPANAPVRSINLTYSAPQKFRFELLEPVYIIDSSGERKKDEEQAIAAPKLNALGSVLMWEFSPPRTGRRYWFKYRLKRA